MSSHPHTPEPVPAEDLTEDFSEAPLEELDPLDDLEELDAQDGFDSLSDSPLDSSFDDEDDESSTALFAGDEGRLDRAQREALVAVIKKRFVTAADAKVWKTLTAHPQIIRSRLHDQFMDLHLDLEREIAFKRPVAPEGGGSFPTLLYDTPWGREDTILLVYLRVRLRNEQAAGNGRVYVDRHDMLEAIDAHRPASATDRAADRKRALKAIETLYKAGLLIGSSTGDRFEVSAAIEVILPVEKLRELLTWLREQNAPAGPDEPGEHDAHAEEGGRPGLSFPMPGDRLPVGASATKSATDARTDGSQTDATIDAFIDTSDDVSNDAANDQAAGEMQA